MKYVVILGDGMADYPVAELGGRTPLQCARKPHIDALARRGRVGLVKTVPDGFAPGSDVANLSVMGYDPLAYYSGRSPLEAVSMGIDLGTSDVTFRCNLVTLSAEADYADKTMLDYSAGEISSAEAALLVQELNRHFKNQEIAFYAGVSYRQCLVWKNGPSELALTPSHDILDQKIGPHLPRGAQNEVLRHIMERSAAFLPGHPVNQARQEKGLRPANGIWLWGEGTKPALPGFFAKYRLKGSVISAVDLIKGIGICAGLKAVDVPGATGTFHTDYAGKARAALQELANGQDWVYVHVEAPDECGHQRAVENKVKAIEMIDELVVGMIWNGLEQDDDYRILVLPDHFTPLALRTHTADPVPFIMYAKGGEQGGGTKGYDETVARETGWLITAGHTLMDLFVG
ncbi:MAG: cofactor-independent phosphoglycerate mutase [Heliobacteriaceae bacterium]|nr:cofactor-independent phosphoglycerate mutase [Heliobacteriaceae bacterium]MDD4587381.1 cofactor-independent phosphoglycerate mutase [Heliobacteriaceae bacterium]